MLFLDENNCYRLEDECPATLRQRAADEPSTQDRLGKVRIGKGRLESTHAEIPFENNEGNLCENKNPENSKKPIRHKYGTYKNVLLTDGDMNKLKSEFHDDWQSRIERLSEYIASSGKTYKNHLATIRAWAKKDKERETLKNRSVNDKWCINNETISLDEIYGSEVQK